MCVRRGRTKSIARFGTVPPRAGPAPPRALAPALAAGLIVCALVPVAGGAARRRNDLRPNGACSSLHARTPRCSSSTPSTRSFPRPRPARVHPLGGGPRARAARETSPSASESPATRSSLEPGARRPPCGLSTSRATPTRSRTPRRQSLDERSSRLDDLHSLAAQDEAVYPQTRQARRSLLRLRRALAARQRHLDALAPLRPRLGHLVRPKSLSAPAPLHTARRLSLDVERSLRGSSDMRSDRLPAHHRSQCSGARASPRAGPYRVRGTLSVRSPLDCRRPAFGRALRHPASRRGASRFAGAAARLTVLRDRSTRALPATYPPPARCRSAGASRPSSPPP
jgi:hypothetical protein